MIDPAAAIRTWLAGEHEHADMADAARDMLTAVLAIQQPDLAGDVADGTLRPEQASALTDGWITAQHTILNAVCDALALTDNWTVTT